MKTVVVAADERRSGILTVSSVKRVYLIDNLNLMKKTMKSTRMNLLMFVVMCTTFCAWSQTKCPTAQVDTSLPVPTITVVDISKSTVSGKVPAGGDGKTSTGSVLICVDGIEEGTLTQMTGGGEFNAVSIPMKTGQLVSVKYVPPILAGGSQEYSNLSATWLAGSCSKDVTAATPPAPTLLVSIDPSSNKASYVGTIAGASSGTVRICVNDLPEDSQTVQISSDGSFKSSTPFTVKAGDSITAQAFTAASNYGPVSQNYKVSTGPLQVSGGTASTPSDSSTLILIGGVEQSGYSSLSQNTDAFLNAFIAGPIEKADTGKTKNADTDNMRLVSGWGRIRLLSAPQPSTQGIVSVFTDPTGQLTTQDYTKVGEALDFVGGPQFNIKGTRKWSLIGEFGVTTPLNSQTVAVTYAAPPPGTVECSTLTSRFTVKNGYYPGLTQAPAGSSTCLTGGYTDIAFSNQDRSNFLIKYAGGFRTVNTLNANCSEKASCTPSKGVLDMTFGQDEAVTRGLLRHVVFKLDGMVPIPTGSASFVYLFGSAYMRIAKNQDYSPLILQPATGVTVPSSTVIVLPLLQPDRDFYRLGVGLNINQIFCKMFSSTCPSKPSGSPTATTPTTSATQ